MSRRRQAESDKFLDALLALLRAAPWWAGPPLMVLAWVLLRFVMPGLIVRIGRLGATAQWHPLVYEMANVVAILAPLAVAVIALVWLVALAQKAGASRRLERQTGLESIRELPWREFEQLLAEAFRRQGYQVKETGPGPDGGIDLILTQDGRRTLVQAKQWKAWKVGVKPVRELFGVQVAERADASILATSGTATAEARRFAAANGIQVIEGADLDRLIQSVQRQPGRAAAHDTEAPETRPDSGPTATEPAPEAGHGPECPACGGSMVRRRARRGPQAGEPFWGCLAYPKCRGILADS